MRRVLILLSLAVAQLAVAGAPTSAPNAASADAAAMKVGEREYFTKCYACHSLEEGGGAKQGPNLWGVFGAKAATREGFAYSPALKKSGITWSAKSMDKWLAGPAALVPGNLMAFAGLPNEADRKALVPYLQKKTGSK